MKTVSLTSARNVAMDYLSKREHSKKELSNKLKAKGFAEMEIEEALTRLEQENLQSDQRFVENYIVYRSKKGFGPIKIKFELRDKGISSTDLEVGFEEAAIDWFEIMQSVREKKFNVLGKLSMQEKNKQSRFLLQRGFSSAEIMELLTGC